jgi:hypothetical protein
MAAGSTVGSNHNSRGNDGEIIAGRGFWPGLSSALKHNSRFACYTLITKGSYPFELNVRLPFCMLTNNSENTARVLMPAYWWLYNMYALERNSWKARTRDRRAVVVQRFETDYLAPDTAAEMMAAVRWLEERLDDADADDRLAVAPGDFERSGLPVIVVKVRRGLAAYRDMLAYYAVKTLVRYFADANGVSFAQFAAEAPENIPIEWESLGGQLVPHNKAEALRAAIKRGEIGSWDEVHAEYGRLYAEYPLDRALNALAVLRFISGENPTEGGGTAGKMLTRGDWLLFLDKAEAIRRYIDEQVYFTKKKDYTDPFRNITYTDAAERDAVLGSIEDNPLLRHVREESAVFAALLKQARQSV